MDHIQIPAKRITEFREFIFSWWKINARDLPWRHTADPYLILVSEIMLQQTQVSRGLPKYREFITAFPDVEHLAHASTADVLRLWKGLGYNRRALYLKKTAEAIVTTHQGVFPKTKEALMSLPGVGAYTAAAIQVFAFRNDECMVDTNIRRIITQFFFSGELQKESIVEDVARMLVPKGKSWEWHQALMDYGALELKHEVARIPKKVSARMPKDSKKKRVPFIQTERFLRGRIIDELRERAWDSGSFISHIASLYGRPEDSIKNTIGRLQKEGICVVDSNTISLPE